MKKHAPYEHEQVEGFDKLENIEVCVDMDVILQPIQTRQLEATLQQIQTQQASQKLIIKNPKISVYNKRSNSNAMDIIYQQTAPKKMKVSQHSQHRLWI
jgi:DNA-binding LytR/AlgR family response regulator